MNDTELLHLCEQVTAEFRCKDQKIALLEASVRTEREKYEQLLAKAQEAPGRDFAAEREKNERLTEMLRVSDQSGVALRQRVHTLEAENFRLQTKAEAAVIDCDDAHSELQRTQIKLATVVKLYSAMTQLADDVMRSLQNDDKSGAMACLRTALSDVLNEIECALAGADKDEGIDLVGAALKSCPCCGGTAQKYKDGNGPAWGYGVECAACGLKTLVDLTDRLKGIRQWQQRCI